MTGEGWNMDFVTKEVAGTLSPFVCREEPFQRAFPPLKAGGWRLGPLGGGVLVETNQAGSSHMARALHWAEGKRMEAGTHGAEQRIGARSKETSGNGV